MSFNEEEVAYLHDLVDELMLNGYDDEVSDEIINNSDYIDDDVHEHIMEWVVSNKRYDQEFNFIVNCDELLTVEDINLMIDNLYEVEISTNYFNAFDNAKNLGESIADSFPEYCNEIDLDKLVLNELSANISANNYSTITDWIILDSSYGRRIIELLIMGGHINDYLSYLSVSAHDRSLVVNMLYSADVIVGDGVNISLDDFVKCYHIPDDKLIGVNL